MPAYAEGQAIKFFKTSVFAECVATKDVRYEATIRVEGTNLELVAEEVEVALGKIKQRADARVGLTVVIAEMAFVVSTQARNAEVAQHLPTIRESLVQLDFDRLVDVDRIGEAVRHAVGPRV